MSDKLNRNNYFNFIVLLLAIACLINSCGTKHRGGETFFKKEEIITTHSILSCPGVPEILLRYTSQTEVQDALRRAYEKKRNEKTSESYTAIRFDKHRSLKVNVTPENMIKCSVMEIPANTKEKTKAHFFFR